ncbi:MAG: saccharopine dehydrogenase NADP-binding domain-containing protein [Desulfobacterales bacterium]|nr:saccharopine dehydrogenase NADP-binding domain-containing protein [Desulfobacterales bacterium]
MGDCKIKTSVDKGMNGNMKALCLGGAGKICRESVYDILQCSDYNKITVADVSEGAGLAVVAWLDDHRVYFMKVDVYDREKTVNLVKQYDIVLDGTTISMNDHTIAPIFESGVHGINLNGCSLEWDFDKEFKETGKTFVPSVGMTPGVTNLMAKYAADWLDTVETIRIGHGAFRPIAFSPSIAETTRIEYDPNLETCLVYEDGKLVQVPPFARPRNTELPEPFGTLPQYIIPHAETLTLGESSADKDVRLIEVRRTWPPKNMWLIKGLYDWGFLRNDKVKIEDSEVGVLDVISSYLIQSEAGQKTDLYGYALHVEVTGIK